MNYFYDTATEMEMIRASKQSDRMRAESEFDALEEEGLKTAKMRKTLETLDAVSAALLGNIKKMNEKFLACMDAADGEMDIADMKAVYDEARLTNEKILKLFDHIQLKIDCISSEDFIVSRSGSYLGKIGLLGEAEEALSKGDVETAKEKLMGVDMAGLSYMFSREVAEKVCRQTVGKEFATGRTWAGGREVKCYAHYELMNGLKKKIESGSTDYKAELKLIKKATNKEMLSFISELRKEFKVFRNAIETIKTIDAEI